MTIERLVRGRLVRVGSPGRRLRAHQHAKASTVILGDQRQRQETETERQTETDTETNRDRFRNTQRQRHRYTDTQMEAEPETEIGRDWHSDIESQRVTHAGTTHCKRTGNTNKLDSHAHPIDQSHSAF